MKEIELTCKLGKELSEYEIRAAAIKALGASPREKVNWCLLRRSIDARTDVIYRYRIQVARASESLPQYHIPEYKDVSSA